MISVDPYDTSYGSLLNILPIKNKIMKYLIDAENDNLNYEYANMDNHRLVIITGKNSAEKELPIWTFPILMEAINGDKVVAIDIRKYVKKVTEDVLNIADIVKDSGSVTFLTLAARYVGELDAGNYGLIKNIERSTVSAFSIWLSDSLNSAIMLNPVEKVRLEVICAFYGYRLFMEESIKLSDIEVMKTKISKTKLSLPMTIKAISDIINKLDYKLNSLDDLVRNILLGLDSEKLDVINKNVLLSTLSNSWYGVGAGETVMIAVENLPLLICLIYSAIDNKSYKRSRIAAILNRNNRKINGKTMAANINIFINENMLNK